MNLPTVNKIKLVIIPGAKIVDACKDAVLMNQRLNCPIYFEFNGHEVVAIPGDSAIDLADAYWKYNVNTNSYSPLIATGRVFHKELKTKKTKKERPKEVERPERPTRRIIL